MKRKITFALLAALCASFVVSGVAVLHFEASAAEPSGWDLSEKTTKAAPAVFTSEQFDYWGNAETEFTSDGVLSTSKTTSFGGNAMNIYGAFSVRREELDFAFSIPLRDEAGNFLDESHRCDNIAVTLYDGATAVASVTVWGNSYKQEYSSLNATFTVGNKEIPEVKLSKKILWKSGCVKMGFSLEQGWMTERYNAAYAPVAAAEYRDELSAFTFDEITRIQIAGAQYSTDGKSAPRVLLKELNGQKLAGTAPLSFDDCFFMSAVEAADRTYLQGETCKFHIAKNFNINDLNTSGTRKAAKTDATYSFGAVTANLGTDKTKGDIGWNSDGKKGSCTESGIYLTLHNPDGTVTKYSTRSAWELDFPLTQAGAYTADFTLLTTRGFLSTRSCSFSVEASGAAVSQLIAAIDLNLPQTITEARAAYEKLSETEKAKVTNYAALGQAERLSEALSALKESFSMVAGASVRMEEPMGIRFGATLDKAPADVFADEGIALTFGTLIAPLDLIPGEDGLKLGADFLHLNIVRSVWDERESTAGKLWFNAAMIGILERNYERVFVGKAYLRFSFNGKEVTAYAKDNDNARSVRQVALAALADEGKEFSASQLEILRRYAGIVE